MSKNPISFMNAREATYAMERQIITDKLADGIDGVEWLVLQVLVDERRIFKLNDWLELVHDIDKKEPESVMIDALSMQSDDFYDKHELNWWITVSVTLTYCSLLRQQDYDRYFNLLQKLKERGVKG